MLRGYKSGTWSKFIAEIKCSGGYLDHQTSCYVTVIKMVRSVDLDFVNKTGNQGAQKDIYGSLCGAHFCASVGKTN